MTEKQTQARIKNVILVLSGKGGVGKSTLATQLTFGLLHAGFKVGLLDIDLTGPSIPRIVGLEGKNVVNSSSGWVPVYIDSEKKLGVMSIGFLLPDPNAPVIWRAMIKQFIEDVLWEGIDFLVVDTPPGTSDEHLSVVETLTQNNIKTGAIIVTTPQGLSVDDVLKEVTFCQKLKVPILGIVENMSGFICPCCNEITNIFSSEGGKILAEQTKNPFLGKVPLDPSFSTLNPAQDQNTNKNSSQENSTKSLFLQQTSLTAIQTIMSNLLTNLKENGFQ